MRNLSLSIVMAGIAGAAWWSLQNDEPEKSANRKRPR
jgi:hypothetical protein